jgi:IS5 family transposase
MIALTAERCRCTENTITGSPKSRSFMCLLAAPWTRKTAGCYSQFSPKTGAPAMPVRLAFGALFIKQRLGLTDEETVEQIRENAYIQFFLGFAGYSSKPPSDPSMMVDFVSDFRKRISNGSMN